MKKRITNTQYVPQKKSPSSPLPSGNIRDQDLDNPNEIELRTGYAEFVVNVRDGSTYQKEQVIGSGSFGKVWSVYQRNEKYAAKEMKKDHYVNKKIDKKKQLQYEIQLHKLMTGCPNIIKYKDFFETDDYIYVIMGLGKQSLQDLIKKRTRLTIIEARYFLVHLIKAISYMHEKDVIHRDLKTGNVLIGDDMQLKICDFGLAIRTESCDSQNGACGTPDWMAPEVSEAYGEQLKRDNGLYQQYNQETATKPKYCFANDVWALGIFLYYFIEGRNPFRQMNGVSIT